MSTSGRTLAFDIETDGLIPEMTTIHSLCFRDVHTGEHWSLRSGTDCKGPDGSLYSIEDGLQFLTSAHCILGHNIISYDIPAIQKLYPWFDPKGIIRDTLLLAKMIWPVDKLMGPDMARYRRGTLPGGLIKRQSLEAWGYRLGAMKGEYSATVLDLGSKLHKGTITEAEVPEELQCLILPESIQYGFRKQWTRMNPWECWNQPMQDYCDVDVDVTTKLYHLIDGHLKGTSKSSGGVAWSERCVELEHRVWKHMDEQEARGFGFDKEQAVKDAAAMKNRQAELHAELHETFGSWWKPLDDPRTGTVPARDYTKARTDFKNITKRRFSDKTGKELKPYVGPPKESYSTDAPFCRVEWTDFNAKSRQQLGERLQIVFGWKPSEWGGKDGKQAKVDETTIREIPESVLPPHIRDLILEEFVVSKTLGQLADGKKAWIDLVHEDGRIRHRVDSLGTVSHRASHSNPNLGQVPAVSKDKDGNVIMGWRGGFGVECRSYFRPGTPGWEQTGVDASGLELRGLGHELEPFDGGDFARKVAVEGFDVHADNASKASILREEAKTLIYLIIYGGGSLKAGLSVGIEDDEIETYANSRATKSYVQWMKKLLKDRWVDLDDRTLALIGKGSDLKKKLVDGIEGLKELNAHLKKVASENGYIVAIDGRKLAVRKPHATLNQALQGGGAIICKEWMMRTDELLKAEGLVPDKDFGQMGFIHDELQFEHRPGLHDTVARCAEQAMKDTAKSLSFKGELTTEAKLGRTWFECH